MDKVKKYGRILSQMLKNYYKRAQPQSPNVRAELIIDKKNHHYVLMYVGWERERFAYFAALHLDIIEGKIWIQQNNLEELIVDELEAKGVDKSEIVLAFLPPEMREFSGFAVA
jgi:hypothetical protein